MPLIALLENKAQNIPLSFCNNRIFYNMLMWLDVRVKVKDKVVPVLN
jgi:hypothetical protein